MLKYVRLLIVEFAVSLAVAFDVVFIAEFVLLDDVLAVLLEPVRFEIVLVWLLIVALVSLKKVLLKVEFVELFSVVFTEVVFDVLFVPLVKLLTNAVLAPVVLLVLLTMLVVLVLFAMEVVLVLLTVELTELSTWKEIAPIIIPLSTGGVPYC